MTPSDGLRVCVRTEYLSAFNLICNMTTFSKYVLTFIQPNTNVSEKVSFYLGKHFATGVELKCQNIFFLKVVMLHIKLKRMFYKATCRFLFCPNTHPQPSGAGKWSKKIF